MAERGKAYWLIDAIASYQLYKHIRKAPWQLWELKLTEAEQLRTGRLEMREDSGLEPIVSQHIPATDFPLTELKLYLNYEGQVPVLYLPSEH